MDSDSLLILLFKDVEAGESSIKTDESVWFGTSVISKACTEFLLFIAEAISTSISGDSSSPSKGTTTSASVEITSSDSSEYSLIFEGSLKKDENIP